MDKKYIEENEIEIKYLRGRLTDDELEGFEVYLMENPELVEQLMLDESLESSLSSEILGKGNESRIVKMAHVQKKSSMAWQSMKIAATLLLGAGVMNFYSGLAPEQGDTKIAYLSALRSGGSQDSVNTVTLPESSFGIFSTQKFVIIARTDNQSNGSFQGVVTSLADQREIGLGIVRPDQYGDVVLALSVRRFPIGKYRLQLKTDGNVMFEQVFRTKAE